MIRFIFLSLIFSQCHQQKPRLSEIDSGDLIPSSHLAFYNIVDENNFVTCTGSAVSSSVLMTSAQCISDPIQGKMCLSIGEDQSNQLCYTGVDILISNDWNATRNIQYDAAFVRFPDEIFETYVNLNLNQEEQSISSFVVEYEYENETKVSLPWSKEVLNLKKDSGVFYLDLDQETDEEEAFKLGGAILDIATCEVYGLKTVVFSDNDKKEGLMGSSLNFNSNFVRELSESGFNICGLNSNKCNDKNTLKKIETPNTGGFSCGFDMLNEKPNQNKEKPEEKKKNPDQDKEKPEQEDKKSEDSGEKKETPDKKQEDQSEKKYHAPALASNDFDSDFYFTVDSDLKDVKIFCKMQDGKIKVNASTLVSKTKFEGRHLFKMTEHMSKSIFYIEGFDRDTSEKITYQVSVFM